MNRPTLSERVYRLMLRLFPADFRADFGDDMSADFQDQRRDVSGVTGMARLWTRTILDLLRRAPVEQAQALREDTRFALRMMRRYSASTTVIVLLLAIGIGANVAVFGLAEPLLRRPLPVPAGPDLVRVVTTGQDGDERFAHPFFLDLQQRSRTFAGVAAHAYTTVAFGRGDGGRSLTGEVVSGNYFDLLGIRPALGRMLQPSDDEVLGGSPVIVISHGTWADQFARAPDVVGRTAYINGHPFQIVGVAPEGFTGSYTAYLSRFWAPLTMYQQARPQNQQMTKRGWSWLLITARLRPDVDRRAASDDVERVAAEIRREFPRTLDDAQHAVIPALGLPENVRESASMVIRFAAAISALLLLVTCANVGGVLQSRAAARVRETAIRYAVGATRFRVVRQWLTESMLLAIVGAAGALVLARWMHEGLIALMGTTSPMELTRPAVFDVRVVAFTVLLALTAGLLFGLLPAWRSASRGERALREHAHSMAGSRWGTRSTRLLVAIQVAISLALMVTAGLLTRSLRNATTFDPGFETPGLVLANINLRRHGYDPVRARAFNDQLLPRLRALPDVRAVSRAAVVPLGGDVERLGFRVPGYQTPDGKTIVSIDVNQVGPDYFETMGIRVLKGRGFQVADTPESTPVVVINETMAKRFWPQEDPVGKSIALAGTEVVLRIVGVVSDIKYYSLDEQPRSYVYAFAEQIQATAPVLHVRAAGAAGPVIAAVKREVAALDPAIVVDQVMTFEELRQQPLALRRAMMVMANAFGALALVLTLVGIYGTMANAVGQRTREIGVRMAFGASVGQVFGLVLRDGFKPVIVGLALGIGAAALLSRLVASELFGVGQGDPLTYTVVAMSVAVSAAAALSLPALRATRVDPVTTLRE
jgi:predicted permease